MWELPFSTSASSFTSSDPHFTRIFPMPRAFLSHVDTLIGGTLAHVFASFKWEVYGSLLHPGRPCRPPGVSRIVDVCLPFRSSLACSYRFPSSSPSTSHTLQASKPAELKAALLASSLILHDLEVPEAAVAALKTLTEDVDGPERQFFAISSPMTWARSDMPSKPEAPTPEPADDEDEAPPAPEEEQGTPEPWGLTEEDFRERRPHPAFRDHLSAERSIARLLRHSTVSGAIVVPGLLYGRGEDAFAPLFRAAWNLREVPLYAAATAAERILPTCHVLDLALAVRHLIDNPPAEVYALVADRVQHTAEEIAGAVARHVGVPVRRYTDKREYLLLPDIDRLLIHCPLVAGAVAEAWQAAEDPESEPGAGLRRLCPAGFVESVPMLFDEYVTAHGVTPVSLFVSGAPCAGRSVLAQKLAAHYRVPHVTVASALATLAETDDALGGSIRARLDAGDRLSDSEAVGAVREFLLRGAETRVHGFVLDGYPRTLEEMDALFAPPAPAEEQEEEALVEDEEGDEADAALPEPLEPDAVVMRRLLQPLHGPVPLPLSARAVPPPLACIDLALPREIAQARAAATDGPHGQEESFVRRWAAYEAARAIVPAPEGEELSAQDRRRIVCQADGLLGPLRFLADAECAIVRVEDNRSAEAVYEAAVEAIGGPHVFPPSKEEIAAAEKAAAAANAASAAKAAEELAARVAAETEAATARRRAAEARLQAVGAQKSALLEARSVPLRQYLIDTVLPALTSAMVEVAEVRPEDPIDYLAEFLMRQAITDFDLPGFVDPRD
jgi:adenylate kinase